MGDGVNDRCMQRTNTERLKEPCGEAPGMSARAKTEGNSGVPDPSI